MGQTHPKQAHWPFMLPQPSFHEPLSPFCRQMFQIMSQKTNSHISLYLEVNHLNLFVVTLLRLEGYYTRRCKARDNKFSLQFFLFVNSKHLDYRIPVPTPCFSCRKSTSTLYIPFNHEKIGGMMYYIWLETYWSYQLRYTT